MNPTQVPTQPPVEEPLAQENIQAPPGKLSPIEMVKKFIVEDKVLAILIGVLLFFVVFGGIILLVSGKGSPTPPTPSFTNATIPTFSSPSPDVNAQFQQTDSIPTSSPSATPTPSPTATPSPSDTPTPSPTPTPTPSVSPSASPDVSTSPSASPS